MKKIVDIFLVSVLMASLFACQKEGYTLTNIPIEMSAREAGSTKALLDASTFETQGNQLHIYDYYNGNAAADIYINDIAESNGAGTWPFTQSHKWTTDGVHKFFGWLEKDNNADITASDFFGSNFRMNNQVLEIPATSINNGRQFDFMYSNIHVRNLNSNPDFSRVPLDFKHLFTSFSVAAKDVALYNEYKLDYIELIGMVETNSANINYSGEEPVVTYGAGEAGATYRFEHTGGIQLGADFIDLTNGTTTREYRLTWPQAARAVKLSIGYRVKDISGTGSDSEYHAYTKTITLPYAWEAGKKNNINLEFKDKEVDLTYEVEPWNRIPEEIDFTDEIMVEHGGTILWDEATVQSVDYSTGEVILFDDENIEATCTFTILTPKGATWTASLISKEGHPDAFRLVDGTKYGTVGEESTIKLVVTNQDPISPRHVCELMITIQTADGRTLVVDDALTPEIVDGVETTYSRFTIIQNFIN